MLAQIDKVDDAAAWRDLASPALSAGEFERIQRIAYRNFGLDLKDGKQSLVASRLGKMMRGGGFASYEEYCRHVESDTTGAALTALGDALTTNFTSFMRERTHFDFLRDKLAPQWSRGSVEIWSAASSTGEEPYSILFTLLEAMGPAADVRILATDISTRVLESTAKAIYQADRVTTLPAPWLPKYFLRGNGNQVGWYRVKPEYRRMVRCARFNLLDSPMPATHFPAIFCRNVMIYFDKPTQEAVVRRLGTVLDSGGHLFIGHSESLTSLKHELDYVAPALYRKPGKGGESWRGR
jgi:chemotaxis protein methyltransferase CheR